MDLISKKEGKYLVFEFNNGKDVRFDLSNGTFIGKKGKPVSSLSSQLSGYSILEVINSFNDDKYIAFLKHIKKITGGEYNYSNLGTFLNHVRKYLNLEQFFACGFEKIELSCRDLRLSDVPKSYIKLCKETDVPVNETLITVYKTNIDMWDYLLRESCFELYSPRKTMYCYNGNRAYGELYEFNRLVSEFNYKPISLAKYIDNIMRYEGESYQHEVIHQLFDYVVMMSAMSNRYEKYPRYLRTTHNIAVRNYNRLKKEFAEDVFKNRIDTSMEFDYKNWTIIYPKSTQDIKDEAVQQNNCVASYIDKVIDGQCHILFLRHKDNKNKSIVTIEVRDKKVVQQKGKFNRDTNEEEKLVLTKYENYLNKNNKKECA